MGYSQQHPQNHAFNSPPAQGNYQRNQPSNGAPQQNRDSQNSGSANTAANQSSAPARHPNAPAANNTQQRPAPAAQQTTQPSELPKAMKVYGKKAALQLSESRTRRNNDYTVMIESAVRSNPNNQADKTYDWKNKISLQLSLQELPLFIAALNNAIPAVEFANHGVNSNKSMRVAVQERNLFISLSEQGKPLTPVPVSFIDGLLLGHFALNEYMRNFPNISSDTALQTINNIASHMLSRNQIKMPQMQTNG